MHSKFRTRGRIIGCSTALVLVLGAMFASSASAKPVPTHTYLAVGDSLAFGYSLQLKNENEALGLPPTAFEHGYVNYYFAKSHQKKNVNGGQIVDTGCPGETTDSMIGNGPLGAAMEAHLGAHGEAPCQSYPISQLHRPYTGGKSQLETDLEVLGEQALKGTPVTTLTLNIGANDELHEVAKCEKEAEPAEAKAGEEAYIKARYYEGKTEEESLAAAHAAGEAAGKKYVKTCLEEHAEELFTHILTNIGASLYVLRNGSEFGSINYTGKLVVQGGYDPYGEVFKGQGEILGGSNLLASILNYEEKPVVEKFGGCYANPQPTFNPGGPAESKRLQRWTNMANTTEYAGKKNGPDIHPTPAGYSTLAKIMITDCGDVE
jgi:hypothetical protein